MSKNALRDRAHSRITWPPLPLAQALFLAGALCAAGCSSSQDDDDAVVGSPTPTPIDTPPPTRISVSPSTLDFGEVDAGQSLEKTVELANTGEDDLLVTITLPFNPSDQYAISASGGAIPDTLAGGETVSLTVTFTATVAGDAVGLLRIDSTDPVTPRIDVVVAAEVLAVQGTDDDGDGHTVEAGDCDDDDASIYPYADELCDGIDNDCDEEVDEEGTSTFYLDADDDGYGDEDTALEACAPGGRWVSRAGDCNDADASIRPEAEEVCDGKDNDCDGSIDEDVVLTFFQDRDGDGYGDEWSRATGCSPPEGYMEGDPDAGPFDCNDNDATVNPAAAETCDGVDNDCDGEVDDGLELMMYADVDQDGFGDPGVPSEGCELGAGYVTDSSDCDDSAADVHPGAEEVCDEVDNDCDGVVDDVGDLVVYADADLDGYGDPTLSIVVCSTREGYVEDDTDCDDADAQVYPGALEACDDKDNDCDGDTDEEGASTFYRDQDEDGHGDATSTREGCGDIAGYVPLSDDCDDLDASVYPGAEEQCNGQDDDCDDEVDEEVLPTWYLDADRDGYGDSSESTPACTRPSRYVEAGGDCDDLDSSVNPGAAEACDGLDNDCDGSIDEGVLKTFYADVDRDGYGDLEVSDEACSASSGMVADSTDCDDGNSAVYPDAPELCDGLDNNCDARIDEEVKSTFYLDADGDGYGLATATIQACSAPDGYVSDESGGLAFDCNDNVSVTYPDANELCDGQDNDCDGAIDEEVEQTLFADLDGDGYGDPESTGQGCTPGGGLVSNDLDCNDQNAASYPAAPEQCDGEDNDCDQQVDEPGDSSQTLFYADADGDGFGGTASSTFACNQPDGYSSEADDCRDFDPNSYPGATERCIGVDDNCDGQSSPPSPPDVASNTPLCAGETLELYSVTVTGASYHWTGPDGFSSDLQNPSFASGPASGGTYALTVTVEGCTSEAITTEVTVNAPSPAFTADSSSPVMDDPTTFYPDESGAEYEWTFEGGDPASSTEENPSVTWTDVGDYLVSLTVTVDGCSASSSDTVTVVDYFASCDDALDKSPGAPDGIYAIDPDGSGPEDSLDVYCDMTTAGGGWTLIYYVDGTYFDGYVANNKITSPDPPLELNDQGDMWNPPSGLAVTQMLFACTTENDASLYYWTYDSSGPLTWFTNTTTDYQYQQSIYSTESNTSPGGCMATHKAESGYGFVVIQTSGCGNCTNMLFGNYHYTSGSQCNSTDNTYGTHQSPWRGVSLGYPLCNMEQTANGRFWIGFR